MFGSIRLWLLATGALISLQASAGEVIAGTASHLSVTVYRAPIRSSDSLDLDRLGGFALVSETRTVHLPAGESRVRFEAVADGIESQTALVSGLPVEIVEKNRDARLLSPAALVTAALGHNVVLIRTEGKSGKITRIPGVIRSDADGGVVFQSAEGIEALRCSGLPETFSFSAATDLGASPTLSVLVRTAEPISAQVTLSYLAHGFDWTANYIATLSADTSRMDLGAWVTLANGNGVTFPTAQTQVVAGRLNRESGEVEPFERASRILAECWPRGSTSDIPLQPQFEQTMPMEAVKREFLEIQASANRAAAAPAVAQLVQEEQLGDLKLYRVPESTDVRSRQIKQVRLLDRQGIPVQLYYAADLIANQNASSFAALRKVRTKNDRQHHLGLPLPSGRVDTFAARGDETLLLSESALRDTAVDENVEIGLGDSPDVQVSAVHVQTKVDLAVPSKPVPPLRGVSHLRSAVIDDLNTIRIHNARGSAIAFELRLQLADGSQLIGAEPAPVALDHRPRFTLTVPAQGSAMIRYQTEHTLIQGITR
jgi:hypothetical protein